MLEGKFDDFSNFSDLLIDTTAHIVGTVGDLLQLHQGHDGVHLVIESRALVIGYSGGHNLENGVGLASQGNTDIWLQFVEGNIVLDIHNFLFIHGLLESSSTRLQSHTLTTARIFPSILISLLMVQTLEEVLSNRETSSRKFVTREKRESIGIRCKGGRFDAENRGGDKKVLTRVPERNEKKLERRHTLCIQVVSLTLKTRQCLFLFAYVGFDVVNLSLEIEKEDEKSNFTGNKRRIRHRMSGASLNLLYVPSRYRFPCFDLYLIITGIKNIF